MQFRGNIYLNASGHGAIHSRDGIWLCLQVENLFLTKVLPVDKKSGTDACHKFHEHTFHSELLA